MNDQQQLKEDNFHGNYEKRKFGENFTQWGNRLPTEESVVWSLFKAAPIEITSVVHSMWFIVFSPLRLTFVCQISAHAWQEVGGQLQKKILNANSFFILTEKQYWMQTIKTPHILCKQKVDRVNRRVRKCHPELLQKHTMLGSWIWHPWGTTYLWMADINGEIYMIREPSR